MKCVLIFGSSWAHRITLFSLNHDTENILNDGNIEHYCIVASVTDNGANIVEACHDFLGKTRHTIFCSYNKFSVSAIHKNTDNLQELIERVRAIVVWLKCSVRASDLGFRKLQINRGIPGANILKPISDCRTRWISWFYMFKKCLKLAPFIGNIVLSNVNSPNMVNASELQNVKHICHIFLPLEQRIKEVSKQHYVTLSKVIPMIKCLVTQYENVNTCCEMTDKRFADTVDKRFV